MPVASRWLLFVLLTGQLMVNVDLAIVNTAAPSVEATLHATDSELELVVSGYILTYALLLITGARLGAIHGYRRVFMIGLAGFVLASLVCGFAPGTAVLIAARIVQGATAALLVPQVLSSIQLNFEGAQRVRAIGYYGVALSIGAVVGQLLGGVLVAADLFGTGWRPVFLINVPLGLALLVAAARFMPEDDRKDRAERLDLVGVATLTIALLLAILPLVFGQQAGWPPWTWLCLLASVPAFAWFVSTQRRITARGGRPLVNPAVAGRPAVFWGLVAHGASTLTYLALLFVLAVYLQTGLGFGPAYSGFAMVAWVAAFGVAGPLLPRLPSRVMPLVPAIGCAVLGLAYLAVGITVAVGHGDDLTLFAVLGVGGFGLGLSAASLITHLTSVVPARFAADLSGVISTNAQLWGALGVAVAGTTYLAMTERPDEPMANRAFVVIMILFAGLSFAATAASMRAVRAVQSSQPVVAR